MLLSYSYPLSLFVVLMVRGSNKYKNMSRNKILYIDFVLIVLSQPAGSLLALLATKLIF